MESSSPGTAEVRTQVLQSPVSSEHCGSQGWKWPPMNHRGQYAPFGLWKWGPERVSVLPKATQPVREGWDIPRNLSVGL